MRTFALFALFLSVVSAGERWTISGNGGEDCRGMPVGNENAGNDKADCQPLYKSSSLESFKLTGDSYKFILFDDEHCTQGGTQAPFPCVGPDLAKKSNGFKVDRVDE